MLGKSTPGAAQRERATRDLLDQLSWLCDPRHRQMFYARLVAGAEVLLGMSCGGTSDRLSCLREWSFGRLIPPDIDVVADGQGEGMARAQYPHRVGEELLECDYGAGW